MKSPNQAAPVARRTTGGSAGAVTQSGCCVPEVAGVCLVSSPLC
jgi:hypothetical protein